MWAVIPQSIPAKFWHSFYFIHISVTDIRFSLTSTSTMEPRSTSCGTIINPIGDKRFDRQVNVHVFHNWQVAKKSMRPSFMSFLWKCTVSVIVHPEIVGCDLPNEHTQSKIFWHSTYSIHACMHTVLYRYNVA